MSKESSNDGFIRILGARQNNLKNIDVDIVANRLTVVTGVSGSGKSSLVFDTLYAEGQRRYVESLSAYARQFLERIDKPRVREILGISPAIAIRQKNTSRNPRSTVGTVTEIYDHLRLLYSRVGTIVCGHCQRPVRKDTVDEIVQRLEKLSHGTQIYITFPLQGSSLVPNPKAGERAVSASPLQENLLKKGFGRLVVDGEIRRLPDRALRVQKLNSAQVLVDRVVLTEEIRDRLSDSLEVCYEEGNGVAEVHILASEGRPVRSLHFTERFECQYCNILYLAPEPRLFSFNSPYGACPACQGFGNTINLDPDLIIPDPRRTIEEGPIDPFNKPRYRRFQRKLEQYAQKTEIPLDTAFQELSQDVRRKIWEGEGSFPGVKGFFRYLERKKYKMHVRIFVSRYRSYTRCSECLGERLCPQARDVHVGEKRIGELTSLPISEIHEFFSSLTLTPSQQDVGERLLKEIGQRIEFLIRVGLEYLTLNRLTATLSGGEMQRIQLAASLGSSLVGTLYVLDEPSIGLHPRDGRRLIEILKQLRDLGNTIVVVEHDREMIESADQIIDMGPGAGELGGEIIHSGEISSLLPNERSVTGRYLKGSLKIATPVFRRPADGHFLTVCGAAQHNLKDITVRIPSGVLVCVTGVSGSGKSTLLRDVLYAGLKKLKGEWKDAVGRFERLEGWGEVSEVLLVDQSPIGRTPRSNPVTYIKAFDEIRRIFSLVREARSRNLSPGHFSFNISGGRCETCQGSGTVLIEMQFLADVELTCEDCRGTRFSKRILEITYKGKSIAHVLAMTVDEAMEYFRSRPGLVRKLRVLQEVGLGYLRLGQSATTLSGGEAQRIKLAAYLSKHTSGRPLFLFDEPTTGLHFDDINKLLRAFDRLISQGATVVVIEHNLDVIKCADWVIDLGPEGGEAGGYLVAEGPPETIADTGSSYTGQFLKKILGR